MFFGIMDFDGRQSKISQELIDLFLANYKATNNLLASARMVGVGKTTIYKWLEKGSQQHAGIYRDFWDGVMRARGQYEIRAAATHAQIAAGGIYKRPVTKYLAGLTPSDAPDANEIVRDDKGEITWREYWRDPDSRALEWEMSHFDPERYASAPSVTINNLNQQNTLVDAKGASTHATDLFSQAAKIMRDLGLALPLDLKAEK